MSAWFYVLRLRSGKLYPGATTDLERDWGKMETVDVVLKEYSYTPNILRFKSGVPYKLQIKNQGTVKRYFTAVEFFKAIATRKVQSNADGEIKAPYFSALEVFPGHEAEGMHGTIEIE